MKYCCYCGSTLEVKIPEDDDRPRHICTGCGEIHYQNPKIICGSIPVWEDRVLLCKRAIEPRKGFWTLPAGFMELGETTMQGAIRETWEEATTRINLSQLYCVFNLPHVDQVYFMYLSTMQDKIFSPGRESHAVELFKEQNIPWQELAFTTIKMTLRFYFEDRNKNSFPLHTGEIIKSNNGNYDFLSGPE